MTTFNLSNFDLLGLVQRDTRLSWTAGTRGGEYAGPCPDCGGRDRFHVQPKGGKDGRGVWKCRACREHWADAIEYVIWRGTAQSFREACEVLRIDPPMKEIEIRELPPPIPCEPPSAAWQAIAIERAQVYADALWTDAGTRSRAWLASRGLTEETMDAVGLGYNAVDCFDEPELWGLPADHKKVWTPRGIVIPWVIGTEIWRLNVRRPLTASQIEAGEEKYRGPAGSTNGLFNAHNLTPTKPALMVEGDFDALSAWQAARDIVTPVALGSTSGARRVRWLARLALCPLVLVATDNDAAGEQAARYWTDALPNALRWRPYLKDCSEMLQAGMDVRSWAELGIGKQAEQRAA